MKIGGYEVFNTEGFLFTRTSGRVDLLTAEFGDGYGAGVRTGSKGGLREWSLKVDVLPDMDDALIDAGEYGLQTRSNYVWDLFFRSKVAGNRPFWIEDPKDGLLYLAEVIVHQIDYDILCSLLYSTGLGLRQRRVEDQESPIPVPQGEINPQQI